jgi:hypothetical protein
MDVRQRLLLLLMLKRKRRNTLHNEVITQLHFNDIQVLL